MCRDYRKHKGFKGKVKPAVSALQEATKFGKGVLPDALLHSAPAVFSPSPVPSARLLPSVFTELLSGRQSSLFMWHITLQQH